jgi:hypothetical protein
VLRDEGEAYGRKLIEAEVEIVTTRYNATIHDFVMLNALANRASGRFSAEAFLLRSRTDQRPAIFRAPSFGHPSGCTVSIQRGHQGISEPRFYLRVAVGL